MISMHLGHVKQNFPSYSQRMQKYFLVLKKQFTATFLGKTKGFSFTV